MLIFVTEPNEIAKQALDLLRAHRHELLLTAEEAERRAYEVKVLFVRTYTQVTTEMLDRFPQVAFVLRAGVGLDNIDTKECERRGIRVINAPGANANAVAEYVAGAAIVALRNFAAQEASLKAGAWRNKAFMGGELKGRTLGLVGCGNVGRMIAKKLGGFELAEIIGYDPYLSAEQMQVSGIRKCELEEVISGADILSLHVPLTPETKHLISSSQFKAMKDGALLINAARGGVVDETALAEALESRKLSGAVLDVLETEPQVPEALRKAPNLILTPHIAGYTKEADQAIALLPAQIFLKAAEEQGIGPGLSAASV